MFNFTFESWIDLPPTGWFLFRRFLDTGWNHGPPPRATKEEQGETPLCHPTGGTQDTRVYSYHNLVTGAEFKNDSMVRNSHFLTIEVSDWSTRLKCHVPYVCPLHLPNAGHIFFHHKTNHISPPESLFLNIYQSKIEI